MEDSRGGRPEDEDIIGEIQSGVQSLQLDSADNVEDKVYERNIEDSRGGRPEDEDIIGEIQSGMRSLQLDSAGNKSEETKEQEVKPEAVKLDKIAEQVYPGISREIRKEICDFRNSLIQKRKRQISSTSKTYNQVSTHPIHCYPGILSIDIHSYKELVASGGVDTNVVLFDKSAGRKLSSLSGHSKKINSIKFVSQDEFIVSGSSDKTVRIWKANEDGDYKCAHILKDHTDEVKAVTVQATNNYFVTASLDNTWCFYGMSSGLCLTRVGAKSDSGLVGYTTAAFHPDGLILSTGSSNAVVQIWDVKAQANVGKFLGHNGPVSAISFSSNGYFMATAAHDGVKLWDLRNLKNFQSFAPNANTPTSVEFDHTGSFLAMTTCSGVRLYRVDGVTSPWKCINTFPEFLDTGKTKCLKFGSDYIAVGSMDLHILH